VDIDKDLEQVIRDTLFAFVSNNAKTAPTAVKALSKYPNPTVMPLMQMIFTGAVHFASDCERPSLDELHELAANIKEYYDEVSIVKMPLSPIRLLLGAVWGYPQTEKVPQGEALVWMVMIAAYVLQLGDGTWSEQLDRVVWEIDPHFGMTGTPL